MKKSELAGYAKALEDAATPEMAIELLSLVFSAKMIDAKPAVLLRICGYQDALSDILMNAGYGLQILAEFDYLRGYDE